MSHRRAPRHPALQALRRLFTRTARPAHTCSCGYGVPIEEPVRPLPAGHMSQRPGALAYDTLLGPAATPAPALRAFRAGAEVRMSAAAVGIEAGIVGHVSRVAPFRSHHPIGVRMCGPWGPLTWFDPWELELVDADTAVIAAAVEHVGGAWIAQASPAAMADTRELDELPLMGSAR